MQQPITKNMQALKRLVRFLKGSSRCVVVYGRQAEQQVVDVFSDSDWAGCTKTRRSNSSSYVMLGGHLIASSATIPNVWRQAQAELSFTDQECFESSWRSGHGCWRGKGGQTACTSGRHSVESDSLKARCGTSETPPLPTSCGCKRRWHAGS